MNMYDDEKQQIFTNLRVQGKAIKTIAKELDLPIDVLLDWDFELAEEIKEAKSLEYDKIAEDHKLTSVDRFKLLAEMHDRLKKELDKRDFSGLPTDKLYLILTDVYERIQGQLTSVDDNDWYDDDDYDPLYDMHDDLD